MSNRLILLCVLFAVFSNALERKAPFDKLKKMSLKKKATATSLNLKQRTLEPSLLSLNALSKAKTQSMLLGKTSDTETDGEETTIEEDVQEEVVENAEKTIEEPAEKALEKELEEEEEDAGITSEEAKETAMEVAKEKLDKDLEKVLTKIANVSAPYLDQTAEAAVEAGFKAAKEKQKEIDQDEQADDNDGSDDNDDDAGTDDDDDDDGSDDNDDDAGTDDNDDDDGSDDNDDDDGSDDNDDDAGSDDANGDDSSAEFAELGELCGNGEGKLKCRPESDDDLQGLMCAQVSFEENIGGKGVLGKSPVHDEDGPKRCIYKYSKDIAYQCKDSDECSSFSCDRDEVEATYGSCGAPTTDPDVKSDTTVQVERMIMKEGEGIEVNIESS